MRQSCGSRETKLHKKIIARKWWFGCIFPISLITVQFLYSYKYLYLELEINARVRKNVKNTIDNITTYLNWGYFCIKNNNNVYYIKVVAMQCCWIVHDEYNSVIWSSQEQQHRSETWPSHMLDRSHGTVFHHSSVPQRLWLFKKLFKTHLFEQSYGQSNDSLFILIFWTLSLFSSSRHYIVNRPYDSFSCLRRSLNRHFELNNYIVWIS